MAETLTLAAEIGFVLGIEAGRVFDERPQLGQSVLCRRRAVVQLVEVAAGGRQLAPGQARFGAAAELRLAAERIEDVQLVGGPREPALFELTGHGDQPFAGGSQILTSSTAPPGVGTGPSVREHAPGDDQSFLALGPELGERGKLVFLEQPSGQIELRLHVGLGAIGPDEGGIPLRAEQQSDGLGQDRLAGTGLAGDRVEPGSQRKLRLVNQHEILDTQAAKHCSPGW